MNTLFGGWKAGEGRSQIQSLQRHLFFLLTMEFRPTWANSIILPCTWYFPPAQVLVTLPTKT